MVKCLLYLCLLVAGDLDGAIAPPPAVPPIEETMQEGTCPKPCPDKPLCPLKSQGGPQCPDCCTKKSCSKLHDRISNKRCNIPLGTVLVSRNKDEKDNTSPGYWNHLAVYVGDGCVVESQAKTGVVKTTLAEYRKRDYNWFPLFPRDAKVGERAAKKAIKLIGTPYHQRSSIRRHIPKKGANCVSVVKEIYFGQQPFRKLTKPDDICHFKKTFTRELPEPIQVAAKLNWKPRFDLVLEE